MTDVQYIGSFQGIASKEGEFSIEAKKITDKSGKEIETHGHTRCWGWFAKEKEAKYAVSINAGDMMETSYRYVVIEKQPSGICNIPKVVAWYEWTGRYPKWSERLVCWGVG